MPRPRKNDKKSVDCPVETTIAAIGVRWKVLVIHHLLEGTQRFGELTWMLGGVSALMLARRLREMKESGVIDRHVHQSIPPKVEYSLTPLGRELKGFRGNPVVVVPECCEEKYMLIAPMGIPQHGARTTDCRLAANSSAFANLNLHTHLHSGQEFWPHGTCSLAWS